jgi:hypothetical protein
MRRPLKSRKLKGSGKNDIVAIPWQLDSLTRKRSRTTKIMINRWSERKPRFFIHSQQRAFMAT